MFSVLLKSPSSLKIFFCTQRSEEAACLIITMTADPKHTVQTLILPGDTKGSGAPCTSSPNAAWLVAVEPRLLRSLCRDPGLHNHLRITPVSAGANHPRLHRRPPGQIQQSYKSSAHASTPTSDTRHGWICHTFSTSRTQNVSANRNCLQNSNAWH